MTKELTIAFIGGGNMASALAAGLIGKRCGAHDVPVIDINASVLERWAGQGTTASQAPDDTLARRPHRILAGQPHILKEDVMHTRHFPQDYTPKASLRAGIRPGKTRIRKKRVTTIRN